MAGRRLLPPVTALVAVAGGLAVAAGTLLPWLTLYGGLHPMRGIIGLYGWLLLAAGVVSVATTVAPWKSWAIRARLGFGLGILMLAFSSWLAFVQMPTTLASMRENPFLVVGRGPGTYVVVGGALLLVLATAVRLGLGPSRSRDV